MNEHSEDLLPSKSVERSRLRQLTRALSESDREALSERIAEHLLAYLVERIRPHQGAVAVYIPIHTEPNLLSAYGLMRDAGFILALPRVTALAQPLEFARWHAGDQLIPNKWGIGEPPSSAAALRNNEISAIVAPCLGYSLGGVRLGYGGGYYDRTLQKMKSVTSNNELFPLTLGVAYDICNSKVLAQLTEPFDQAFDAILTEAGRY